MNELQLVDRLIEKGEIAPEKRAELLSKLTAPPGRSEWALFLYLAGTGFGAALSLAGVLYLTAFNWEALGIFSKEIFVFGLLSLCAGAAIARGPSTLYGQIGNISAAVLSGAMLVIYSQVYQSGADPWQLFALWALLALPFVLASRTPPLWALLFVLLDVTAGTWSFWRFLPREETFQILFWTALAAAHLAVSPLWDGWLRHVLRIAALAVLLPLAVTFAFEHKPPAAVPAFLIVVFGSLATQGAYLARRAAAPAATLGCICLVSVFFSASIEMFGENHLPDASMLLLFGFELALLCAGAFTWLLGIPRLQERFEVKP